MAVAGGSNIGLRKDNEDSYEIKMIANENGQSLQLLAIADGMGGHEHGQLASYIAVKSFMALSEQDLADGFTLDHMRALFVEANQTVFARQEQLHDGIMGTTLTVAAVQDNQLLLGHVGDSRCYIYRDNELIQISVDHTYYAELMRLGKFEAAQDEKQRNVLMRAIGPEAQVEGQYLQQSLQERDILVLCTDGFYNSVTAEELSAVLNDVLREACHLQSAVAILLNKALEQGARDNLTLIVYLHEKNEI